MKKFLVIIMVALLVCTISIAIAKSKFPDTVDTKYDAAVEKLTDLNVITGFPDGTFKPGEPVTRAQLCKMIVEGLDLKNANEVALYQFSDVTQNHWGYKWIKTAVDNNIIVGYPDGTFQPDATVTYAESMTMILRALKLEAQMKDKTWPSGYMNEASAQGLLKDVSYTNPNSAANRGEVSMSMYNMVLKVEKQKEEEEQAKKEAQEKAEEEAKKNALDFGLVDSTSSSKSVYYLKFDGDKTKYPINSISGKTKLTDSKVEGLEGNVIGYKETKDELDIPVTYTKTSFDKALVISKVETDTITFSDKSKWNISTNTFKNTYNVYSFIRITADVDKEDTLVFEKVDTIGVGLSKVKYVKGERVLVDTSNKVVVFLKGIDADATITKGVVDTDSSSSTEDYLYGWVTSVTTEKKTDYVKINKKKYEVYSKSKDFVEDTFVVFEIYDEAGEDDEYDMVKLVKSYGPSDIDDNCKIVSSVSSKTKVTYKGDSSATDYSSTSIVKKYKNYEIVSVEVEESSKKVVVKDYEIVDGVDDLEFAKGDRVIIDTNKEVFVVFTGLTYSKVYEAGKLDEDSERSEDTATKYTVTFKWKDASVVPSGVSLPYATAGSKTTVTKGAKITYTMPKATGYTFTANVASGTVINANTTITITCTKSTTPTVTPTPTPTPTPTATPDPAKEKVEKALAAKEKAEKELQEAQKALEDAKKAQATCEKNITDFDKQNSYDPKTIDTKISNAENEVTTAKATLADAKSTQSSCKTACEEAKAAKTAAKEAYDNAGSGDDIDALKDAYTEASLAYDDAVEALDAANEAVTKAQNNVTAKEKVVKDLKNLKSQRQLLDKALEEAKKKVTTATSNVTAKEKALEAAEKAYDDAVKEMIGA